MTEEDGVEPTRPVLSRNRMITVGAAVVTVIALVFTWYVLLTRGDDGPAAPAPATTTVPEGVPAGWPQEIPVWEPSTVWDSERTDSSEGTFYGLTLQVPDDGAVKGAYYFYGRVLRERGFSVSVDSPNETSYGFFGNLVASDDRWTVNVIAATDTKLVTVGVSPAVRR